MRILHVSDVHGAPVLLKRVIRKEKFDLLVVSGDFETVRDVNPLEGVKEPVLTVHGNYESPEVLEALEKFDINGRPFDFGGWRFIGIGYGENVTLEPHENMVVVSHDPPFGAGDLSWIGPVGSQDFLRAIQKLRPQFWLCGHIHEGRGVFKVGRTTVVNAGSIAEKSYAVIDTETGKAVMKRLV